MGASEEAPHQVGAVEAHEVLADVGACIGIVPEEVLALCLLLGLATGCVYLLAGVCLLYTSDAADEL